MNQSTLPDDIQQLSIPDRIELAGAIWDSIANENGAVELTPGQRAELDRRLDARRADPNAGTAWHEVKRRILAGS